MNQQQTPRLSSAQARLNNIDATKQQWRNITDEYLALLSVKGADTRGVKAAFKRFVEYLENAGHDFVRLRPRHADEFQYYLATFEKEDGTGQYSTGTVGNILGHVTTFYDHLRRAGYVPCNPFTDIRRTKRRRGLPKNVLNEEQMSVLLKELRTFWTGADLYEKRGRYVAHVIAEFMYSTGARINEVAKLRAGDIDFDRNTVTVTDDKTEKTRECVLNEYASKVLFIYMKTREYVLFGKNGGDMELLFGSKTNIKNWLNSLLKKRCAKLQLPEFTSHGFRHALGYHLLRAGCDIRYIQQMLGHEHLGTTQVYTKVDKHDLKSVLDEYHPRKIRKSNEEL